MPSEQHLITPTYQDILILALNAIITRLMDQDQAGAWMGLKALHNILPPECEKECQEVYEEVTVFLSKDADVFDRIYLDSEKKGYLGIKNYTLLNKIKNSLVLHKYLILDTSIKPMFESTGKIL